MQYSRAAAWRSRMHSAPYRSRPILPPLPLLSAMSSPIDSLSSLSCSSSAHLAFCAELFGDPERVARNRCLSPELLEAMREDTEGQFSWGSAPPCYLRKNCRCRTESETGKKRIRGA